MTDEDLREAAERYREAEKAASERRRELYRLIRLATESGRTLREVAALVGLSHGRVDQIGKGSGL
jgi:DNA-directed RNA polymerase sigma subunit (sigma70/sigma32)